MSADDSEVRVLGPDGYEETGKTAWQTIQNAGDDTSPPESPETEEIERAEDTQQAHTQHHDGPVDWYEPPYPPKQLAKLLERSETHAACVQAKSQGVAGFGFDLIPHGSADTDEGDDPPGFDTVNEFWNSPNSTFQLGPDKQSATPVGVLEHAWDDFESIGWLGIEVLCNTNTGEPTGLAHIPAHTIRVRKDGPGFVQIDSSGLPVKFFGKAGDRYGDDKTFVDSENGKSGSSVGEVDQVANELLVIRNYAAIAPHYGLPDVIPALQTIAGDVSARQYNSKFFENDGVPRFAVIVEGGELTDKAWDELKETFENMTVEDNAHRGVLLEAVSTTASEYGEKEDVNIRIEPLTVGVEEDASFTEYRDANEHDILQAHSVPPVEAERTEDSNYANAREQRRKFAQGTLRPKQETFAARLYNIIHVQGLDVPGWTIDFHLHGGENKQREAEIAQTIIEASMGSITVNEAREILPVSLDPMEGAEGNMMMAALMTSSGQPSAGMGGLGGDDEDGDTTEAFESGKSQQRADDHGYSITERSDFEPEKPSVRSIPGAQTPGEQQAERASTEKAQYSEGSVVEYDSDGHLGAVVAVMTESFTVPVGDEDDEEVDASSDNPKYVVARETQGFGVFEGSDLTGGEFPSNPGTPDDLTDSEEEESYRELADGVDSHSELAGEALRLMQKDIGWDSYPPTWRESSIPNRVILLDVWTSMGATFTGCVRHMRDDMASPNDFCASTKDEVLGTTRWRNRF